MLKHSLLALTLAAALATVAPSAIAQDSGSSDQQAAPSEHEHGRGGHFDPEKRTEMLTKQLKLTSEQQSKVLDIFKSAQAQADKVRSDSSVPQEDRRSKMMEIHKTSNESVRALLDANQQKKFDAMQNEHGQWGGHHPNGQVPDSAPQQ